MKQRAMMTIEDLRISGSIIFECISGSRAYGLNTPSSDLDIRGVFIAPRHVYYSMNCPDQVNDERNDVVYFELKKFVSLLMKNNPGMLEMLAMQEDCIQLCHPLFKRFTTEMFLSMLCRNSYIGYANEQLHKAHGLNKKIINPMRIDKKSILEFCHVPDRQGTISVAQFLERNGFKMQDCGLVALAHMRDTYGLYHSVHGIYKGIVSGDDAMDVQLSSVEKGEQPVAVMSFNKDGYSKYCRDYREYHAWVANRNPARYEATVSEERNYDSKNMMHTFRLIYTAMDIARTHKLVVRRPERAELLDIRNGLFTYDRLKKRAELLLAEVEEAFRNSGLREVPDYDEVNRCLADTRKMFYDMTI